MNKLQDLSKMETIRKKVENETQKKIKTMNVTEIEAEIETKIETEIEAEIAIGIGTEETAEEILGKEDATEALLLHQEADRRTVSDTDLVEIVAVALILA